MKKTFIATAATLACAGAWAQVTLYGLADVGITRVTGYAQGSVTQLNSGIMEGSRWGVKGEEDLGGGYKANFGSSDFFYDLDNQIGTDNAPLYVSQVKYGRQVLFALTSATQPYRRIPMTQKTTSWVGAPMASAIAR